MTIDINITAEELAARRKRVQAAKALQEPDRVPVMPYMTNRYWLPKLANRVTFAEYYRDPRTMLQCQLLGQKWMLENLKSDKHEIVLAPEFGYTEFASALGAEVEYPNDDIPWIKRPHFLQDNLDLDRVRAADVHHGGLHGVQIDYFKKWREMADDYVIRLKDGAEIPARDCICLHAGGMGGVSWTATDLRGFDFSTDLYDRPEWVRELLDIIADKTIDFINYQLSICGKQTAVLDEFRVKQIFIGDDATAQMSPELYLEIGLPPLKKLADYFRAKGFRIIAHNCGKADHLVPHIASTLRPDEYLGISYLTDKRLLEKHMAGKIALIGGISTLTLRGGTPEEVKREVRQAIEILAPHKGYIVMDGHNIAPDSPVENINAMHAAAVEFGKYRN